MSSRSTRVRGRAEEAFALIQRIGGATDWYAVDWFWRLRGLLDRLRGGEGLRRRRRDPDDLQVGDAIDFWRVERLERGRRLLLSAEMKIPGRLWLQFEVEPRDGGTQIRQTTIFDPAGYVGLVYWYLPYPVHHGIFAAMPRGLARASGQASGSRSPGLRIRERRAGSLSTNIEHREKRASGRDRGQHEYAGLT